MLFALKFNLDFTQHDREYVPQVLSTGKTNKLYPEKKGSLFGIFLTEDMPSIGQPNIPGILLAECGSVRYSPTQVLGARSWEIAFCIGPEKLLGKKVKH